MITGVHLWWLLISLISILNIGIWVFSATRFARRKHIIHPRFYPLRRWVFWLSGIYVFVCAFRSFLPRIDLERICLVESWMSSMFVGRAVTTVAELGFIIQCAILLREAAIGTKLKTITVVFWIIVPLIVVAEGFSWYAIVTTNYFGSIIEESLWTVTGMLLLLSFISLWPYVSRRQRYFLAPMIVYAIGFVIFMTTVDVPMYWARWQADLAQGVTFLSFSAGLKDMLRACTVSFSFTKWHQEIPWMTLYFSITVWVSMAFAYAPSFKLTVRTKTVKPSS